MVRGIRKRVLLFNNNIDELEKTERLFLRDSLYNVVDKSSDIDDLIGKVELLDIDYVFIHDDNLPFQLNNLMKTILKTKPKCRFEFTYKILEKKFKIPYVNFKSFYEAVINEIEHYDYTNLDPNVNINELGFSYEKNRMLYKKYLVRISDILVSIGVPTNITGYKYLREAILLGIENPMIIISVTKQLYPNIARKFNSTPCSVERSIRHAIEEAWQYNRLKSKNRFLSFDLSDLFEDKPSNSRFISLLADRLRLEIEDFVV